MQKRTFLSIMAIAFVAIFVTSSERSTAQQDPNCCNYVIDVDGIDPACFPITITTDWGPGIFKSFTVTSNGVYVDNIPNCPPVPALPFSQVVGLTAAPGCPQPLIWTANLSCCIYILIR